jgi:hypothetical protein
MYKYYSRNVVTDEGSVECICLMRGIFDKFLTLKVTREGTKSG